jgi:hypothetical protein
MGLNDKSIISKWENERETLIADRTAVRAQDCNSRCSCVANLDGARPIIFYNRFAYCWQPPVKGWTMMVNSVSSTIGAWRTFGSTNKWLDGDEDMPLNLRGTALRQARTSGFTPASFGSTWSRLMHHAALWSI